MGERPARPGRPDGRHRAAAGSVVARLAAWLGLCLGLLLGLSLGPAGLANAATYSNTSTPYQLIDSSTHTKVGHNTTPYKFKFVTGCGTSPPVLDDTLSDLIPLGFTFVFGTTSYTGAYISTNGRLQFGNTTCGSGTDAISPIQTYPYGLPHASMNGVMKIFGVDLDPTNLVDKPNYPSAGSKTPCTSTATCYISVATLGSAPSRQFVVTWRNVPEWVSASKTSGSFDLQIIVNEDGSFIYQFGTISHGGTGTAQIGWQTTTSDYQVLAFGASAEPPPNSAILFYIPKAVLAYYQMEAGAWAAGGVGQVADSAGSKLHGTALGAAQVSSAGYVCRGASIPLDQTANGVNALKLGASFAVASENLAGSGAVMFWVNLTTRTGSAMHSAQLLDAGTADRKWFYLARASDGTLTFKITDSTGTDRTVQSAAGALPTGSWQHVAIVWDFNGQAGTLKDSMSIYVNGVLAKTTTFTSDGALQASLGAIHIGDNPSGYTDANGSVNSLDGTVDEVQVFNTAITVSQVLARKGDTHACGSYVINHLELQSSSWGGVSCTPGQITVLACADSSFPCTNPYTKGFIATFGASGANANWVPMSDATLAVGYGNSSGVKSFYQDVGSTRYTATEPTTTTALRCNGSGNCTWAATDSGLIFDVPHHVSDVAQSITVSAVRKSDNATVCTPAFANATKNVTFNCSYANPASGVLPVRVGGVALNNSANASAACDASGKAVALSFNASGVASTTVQYADVGQITLAGRHAGTAGTPDANLVMSGSDSFISAPASFSVIKITSGNLTAGSAFSAVVQSLNFSGNATPNFGREAVAEAVRLGFVRTQPQGTAAVNGSFSGSLGGFSGGVATGINLVWTEVGRGEVTALLSSGSYLGSGLHAAGASNGSTACAVEGGTCVLPTGVTAAVSYGANGYTKVVSGLSGAVACNSSFFGNPLVGVTKACSYTVTAGTSAASTGTAGPFLPHHFDVAATPACSAYTYAGQPLSATVTARNAAGATTVNYDGSVNTLPNFAKITTLSEAVSLGAGSLSGNSLAASAFARGIGNGTPAYAYKTKATPPMSLTLRATDSTGVSSRGWAEPAALLRSGRLRMSNAYGSAGADLQVPVVAEYWSGNAWVLNSDDNCTGISGNSVALSNPRSANGTPSDAVSSASTVKLAQGSGLLTLSRPKPEGSSLSLDLAINLGSDKVDQSCLANHPVTSGASQAWLRAQNGACAATTDRDPAARASFGIFNPESRRTVHVRDIF